MTSMPLKRNVRIVYWPFCYYLTLLLSCCLLF